MSAQPLKVLVDTNVWLHYFEGGGLGAKESAALIRTLIAQEAVLYSAALSLKDVYYLHQRNQKKKIHARGVCLDKGTVAAIRESAWSCVRSMRELSIVVPVGQSDILQATTYRDLHDDFEDDLVLAAAQRVEATYLVTFDGRLCRRAPVACLDPASLLTLLHAGQSVV